MEKGVGSGFSARGFRDASECLLSGVFLEGATTSDIRSNVSDEILEGDNSWCGCSSDSDLEDDPPESQGADGAGINAVDKASSSVYSLDLLQVPPDQIRQSLVL
jgi:hypothetical protein